jgi:hypothetical protein
MQPLNHPKNGSRSPCTSVAAFGGVAVFVILASLDRRAWLKGAAAVFNDATVRHYRFPQGIDEEIRKESRY